MPLRNVATTFTIEQQRLEINNLAGDVNNIATGATTVGTATTASALAAGATGTDLTLSGTLTVNGTQTILNTETLQVEDKEIVIGNVSSPTDATAHGGGWKLKGANNKTITYNQTGDKWESNKNFEAPNLAYTSGGQTFSGDITIQKGSADNADLMIGATGTGEARIYLDASNGDFSGGDYGYFKQTDAGILKIGNMNAGGILFNVGEGSGGAGTALSIINNGNVGIGIDTPNRELEVYNNASQCSVAITAATTGQSSLWFADTADINVGGIYYEHSNDAMGFRVDNSSDKLRITNDKVMVGVDLKCDTHHSRDIGTASNAFKDIYGQTITVSTAYDAAGDLRSIPANTQSSAYSLASSDAGKCVLAGGQISIPSDVGFVQGDAVTIINNSASAINFAHSSVTLYNTADGTTLTSPNGELGARGMCTIYFVSNTVAYISGSQIS